MTYPRNNRPGIIITIVHPREARKSSRYNVTTREVEKLVAGLLEGGIGE